MNINNNFDYTHILVTFIKPSYKRYKKSVKLGYQYLIASTFFYNIENIKFEINDMLLNQIDRMDIKRVYYINVFHSENLCNVKNIYKNEEGNKIIEVINISWKSLFLTKEIYELLFDYKYKNEYIFFNFEINSWYNLKLNFAASRILISCGGTTRRYHQLSTIHFKMSIFLSWMLEKYSNKLDIIDGSFYSFNENKIIKRSLGDFFNKNKEEIYINSLNRFKESISTELLKKSSHLPSLINKYNEIEHLIKKFDDQLPSLIKYINKQELIDKLLEEHYNKNNNIN